MGRDFLAVRAHEHSCHATEFLILNATFGRVAVGLGLGSVRAGGDETNQAPGSNEAVTKSCDRCRARDDTHIPSAGIELVGDLDQFRADLILLIGRADDEFVQFVFWWRGRCFLD